jgi:hypothetical protein
MAKITTGKDGNAPAWLDKLDKKLERASGRSLNLDVRSEFKADQGAASKSKAAGPDTQKLAFHCANDGAEFFVLFARKSATEKLRIQSIQTPQTGAVGTAQATSPIATSFSAGDFDMAGWQCGCCKHNSSPLFVRCSRCECHRDRKRRENVSVRTGLRAQRRD